MEILPELTLNEMSHPPVTDAAGCAVTAHHHGEIEEIYCVVSRRGLMTVADETR